MQGTNPAVARFLAGPRIQAQHKLGLLAVLRTSFQPDSATRTPASRLNYCLKHAIFYAGVYPPTVGSRHSYVAEKGNQYRRYQVIIQIVAVLATVAVSCNDVA
eukprot:4840275-Pleurochrysis_carterae.AAC.8